MFPAKSQNSEIQHKTRGAPNIDTKTKDNCNPEILQQIMGTCFKQCKMTDIQIQPCNYQLTHHTPYYSESFLSACSIPGHLPWTSSLSLMVVISYGTWNSNSAVFQDCKQMNVIMVNKVHITSN